MQLDYYELLYNDIKNTAVKNGETNISGEENALLDYIIKTRNADVNKDILLDNIIKEVNANGNIKFKNEFKFADAQYMQIPVFEANKLIGFIYEPLLLNKNIAINPKDAIKIYDDFNINNLPLIEIAHHLNITVRKLRSDENYGSFNVNNMTIELRTNSPRTYLHELSHAIDYLLGQNENTSKNSDEVVAELSALYLCKKYNINTNDENSIAYINAYKRDMVLDKNNDIINRVKNINYFIIECKSEIEKRHGTILGNMNYPKGRIAADGTIMDNMNYPLGRVLPEL